MAIRKRLNLWLASGYCDEPVTVVAGSLIHDKAVWQLQKIEKSSEPNWRCSKWRQCAQISNAVWNPKLQMGTSWSRTVLESQLNCVQTVSCEQYFWAISHTILNIENLSHALSTRFEPLYVHMYHISTIVALPALCEKCAAISCHMSVIVTGIIHYNQPTQQAKAK